MSGLEKCMRGKFVSITARQRRHYSMMTEQAAARASAIRALVRLSQFPDDSEVAIRSLRLLDASPVELESATAALVVQDRGFDWAESSPAV